MGDENPDRFAVRRIANGGDVRFGGHAYEVTDGGSPIARCNVPIAAQMICRAVNAYMGQDGQELEWWRNFSLKFMPGNLPRVNSALLGHRFVLMVDEPGGELVRWEER